MKILERFLQIKHAESGSPLPFESWLMRQYKAVIKSEGVDDSDIPGRDEIIVLMKYREGEYGDDIPETPPRLVVEWVQLKEPGKVQAGDECYIPGKGPSVVESIVGPHAFNFYAKGDQRKEIYSSPVVDTGALVAVLTPPPSTPAEQTHKAIAGAVEKLTPLQRKAVNYKPSPLVKRTKSG